MSEKNRNSSQGSPCPQIRPQGQVLVLHGMLVMAELQGDYRILRVQLGSHMPFCGFNPLLTRGGCYRDSNKDKVLRKTIL